MAGVIVTAEVKDAKQWEEGFRAKRKLFEKMTQRVAHDCVTDQNMAVMQSDEAAKAMASDGVKADTVNFCVLDKTFET